jgi:hypothetical protein
MSSGFGASGSGSTGDGMRVGNAEREAIAGELREHYASGRLTLEELNERLEAAFAAKTRADLGTVMRDLPSAQSFPPPTAGAGAQGPGQQWGGQQGSAGPHGGGAGGPGAGWGHGGWGHGGRGAGYRGAYGAGQRAGSVFSTMVAVALLGLFGVMAVAGFGIGAARPLGIGLLIAAIALLRRLIFGIFGRRRARGGRRPRRRW